MLRDATEFHAPGRVSGGTWERIWAIAEYAQDSFVVQLDADTVTVERPTGVLEAIAQKASFTLGTDDGQRIAPVAVTATWARARAEGPSDHIQQQAESLLDQFDPPGQWQYVRGCSGFAGFAPGSISPQRLHAVSDGMRALLGERWDRWGTEQVTSNLLIASSQNGRVLPHPEYCAPHRRTDATVFMHFIGYVRHKTGLYGQLATRLARELAANPAGRRAA
ncbi:MAG TPA: hypothetical protein VEZ89_12090 [Rubrivivax sp.]|nr:hypothetical protein [Rubrivivax sp.]